MSERRPVSSAFEPGDRGATYGTCPRCGHARLRTDRPVMNALSRKDNKTYVCAPCGTAEALLNVQGGVDADVWPGYPGPLTCPECGRHGGHKLDCSKRR